MMAGYESQLDAITQKSDALGIPRSQVIRVYSEAFETMIKNEKIVPDVFRRYCTELAIWQALFPNAEPFPGVNPTIAYIDKLGQVRSLMRTKINLQDSLLAKLEIMGDWNRDVTDLREGVEEEEQNVAIWEFRRARLNIAGVTLNIELYRGVNRMADIRRIMLQTRQLSDVIDEFRGGIIEMTMKLADKLHALDGLNAECDRLEMRIAANDALLEVRKAEMEEFQATLGMPSVERILAEVWEPEQIVAKILGQN